MKRRKSGRRLLPPAARVRDALMRRAGLADNWRPLHARRIGPDPAVSGESTTMCSLQSQWLREAGEPPESLSEARRIWPDVPADWLIDWLFGAVLRAVQDATDGATRAERPSARRNSADDIASASTVIDRMCDDDCPTCGPCYDVEDTDIIDSVDIFDEVFGRDPPTTVGDIRDIQVAQSVRLDSAVEAWLARSDKGEEV